MKPWILVLILAIAVYGGVFVYTFNLSPMIKEQSIENWLQIESSKSISYMESSICRECHLKLYKNWTMGNHSSVECESCHDYGAEHVKFRSSSSILVEKSRDSCLVCHREVTGRDAIKSVSYDHGSGVICTYCHDPHR
uniref:Cytochrome c-552/4 domain-containing protein n=1 Tax=Archaeoglobus fulgidus TaxID=2234 RepID=A0A7J3M555_ARCFL